VKNLELLESTTIPPFLAADWRQRPVEEQPAALIQSGYRSRRDRANPDFHYGRNGAAGALCRSVPSGHACHCSAAPEIECIDRGRRWRRMATEHKAASLCSTPGSPESRPIACTSIGNGDRSHTEQLHVPITDKPPTTKATLPILPFRWRVPSRSAVAGVGLTYDALRV